MFWKIIRLILSKPFIPSVLVSILLAYLFPEVGVKGGIIRPEITVKYGAVFIIFLISGLSLKTEEFTSVTKQCHLHLFIQGFTLIFIPLVVQILITYFGGLGVAYDLQRGFVAVSCMPPPVSSAVILTKAAGGNEAAAVFNSALGSFLGIFATPALLFILLGHAGEVSFWVTVFQITSTVVMPVLLGQYIKCRTSNIMGRKKQLSLIGNLMLLLIIFTTFCDTFSQELEWLSFPTVFVTVFIVICLQALFMYLVFRFMVHFSLYFSPEDTICALFCATHKSLTLGFPLLQVLHGNEPSFALISFPLLVYHPTQILFGSLLVPSAQTWIQEKNKWYKTHWCHV